MSLETDLTVPTVSKPKRGPGRPPGLFSQKQEAVYNLLKAMEQPVKEDEGALATKIGVSTRHLYRILQALKKQNRIEMKLVRTKMSETSWVNRRLITVVQAEVKTDGV